MRLAVYGAVLVITLGSVLLGLDWLSAPMSPMADTEAGLHAPPAVRPPPAPVVVTPVAPNAPIGAPIVPPKLVAPAVPSAPAATAAQAPACAADRRAGAASARSAMSRGRLHGRLSIVPRVGLHLYAERRAAQALHEITRRIVPIYRRNLRGTGLAARALRLDTATFSADPTMQFLVYLTVLMVSISTVLLEVHWLTSPPPQPKPAVAAQAANVPAPPRKVEGPTAALSPVYPKPTETPSAAPSNEAPNRSHSPATAITGLAKSCARSDRSCCKSRAAKAGGRDDGRCRARKCGGRVEGIRNSFCRARVCHNVE